MRKVILFISLLICFETKANETSLINFFSPYFDNEINCLKELKNKIKNQTEKGVFSCVENERYLKESPFKEGFYIVFSSEDINAEGSSKPAGKPLSEKELSYELGPGWNFYKTNKAVAAGINSEGMFAYICYDLNDLDVAKRCAIKRCQSNGEACALLKENNSKAEVEEFQKNLKLARDHIKSGEVEEIKKSESFLSEVLKAALIGTVEASIDKAINGECEVIRKSKTKQVMPGSPQYGKKTTVTKTFKNCEELFE